MKNLKFYYAVDPFESAFLMLYSARNTAMFQIYTKILAAFKKAPFSTLKEYVSVYYAFLKEIKVSSNMLYKYSETYEKGIKKFRTAYK